jgi:hypothetical protein
MLRKQFKGAQRGARSRAAFPENTALEKTLCYTAETVSARRQYLSTIARLIRGGLAAERRCQWRRRQRGQ